MNNNNELMKLRFMFQGFLNDGLVIGSNNSANSSLLQGYNIQAVQTQPSAVLYFSNDHVQNVTDQIDYVKFNEFASGYDAINTPASNIVYFERSSSPDDYKINILNEGIYQIDYGVLTGDFNFTEPLFLDLMFEGTFNTLYSGEQIKWRTRIYDYPTVPFANFCGDTQMLGIPSGQNIQVYLRVFTTKTVPLSYDLLSTQNVHPNAPQLSPYLFIRRTGSYDNISYHTI